MSRILDSSEPLRLAACDVGSNATRLVIGRVLGTQEPFVQREASYRVPLRLGDDVFTSGSVSDEKIAGLVQIGKAYRLLIDFFRPCGLRACATAALREAANRDAVVERIRNEANLQLEIITGAEEARVLHASICSQEQGPERGSDEERLYVDVGGGSTELTLITHGRAICSESFRIGGVRLLRSKVDAGEWDRMQRWIEQLPRSHRNWVAVGTGGNIEHIGARVGASGSPITRAGIHDFIESLEPMSLEERVRSQRLNPDRADVIVPAGKIYEQVMRWAQIETMLVPKVGLGDGVLNQMLCDLTRDIPNG